MALEVARNIGPPRRALDLASSPQEKRNYKRIADRPRDVKANRRRVIRELTSISAKLKPLQVKLQDELNPLAPARGLHLPLIAFLVDKLGYPDKSPPPDFTNGVGITGAIAPSRVLAPSDTPATKKFASIRSGLRVRNNRIVRPLVGSKKPVLRAKWWELSQTEHEKGWLSKPVRVTKFDLPITICRLDIAFRNIMDPRKESLGLLATFPELWSMLPPTWLIPTSQRT